jgi:hypothetical protein
MLSVLVDKLVTLLNCLLGKQPLGHSRQGRESWPQTLRVSGQLVPIVPVVRCDQKNGPVWKLTRRLST